MKYIDVRGLRTPVSKFSFGTGSLHHLGTTRRQVALIEHAVEYGFTHFDTSPLYGFGSAESIIGKSSLIRNDAVTVATKVGLYPPGGADQFAISSLVRKAAGKIYPELSRAHVNWSVSKAESSLANSLKKLNRDSVDVLWFHEPLGAAIATDEWLDFMSTVIRDGKVMKLGFAGERENIMSVYSAGLGADFLVQTRTFNATGELYSGKYDFPAVDFAYGHLAGGIHDPSVAEELLVAALRRKNEHSILISTRKQRRIAFLSCLADRI